jgi:hypothetical protein
MPDSTTHCNHRPPIAVVLTIALSVGFDFIFDAGPHILCGDCTYVEGLSRVQEAVSVI